MSINKTPQKQDLLIECLNHLEKIKTKLTRPVKTKPEVEQSIDTIMQNLKILIKHTQIHQQELIDKETQIDRLKQQQQQMLEKHNQILQSIQILIYQQDYQDLKNKIDYYKSQQLNESFLTFATQNNNSYNSEKTLNRAFVLEEEEKGYCEFDNFEAHSAQKMVAEKLQQAKLQSALQIIYDQENPFEQREQAWLGIVYTKNAKEQSEIFDQARALNSCSSRNLNSVSDISLTEQCQPLAKEKLKDSNFSGKKIKSMTLLKEKSSKRKSLPKTSVKKSVETHRELENIECSEEKVLKRKLNYVHKTNEKDPKKKSLKPQDANLIKSFKKTLHSHN